MQGVVVLERRVEQVEAMLRKHNRRLADHDALHSETKGKLMSHEQLIAATQLQSEATLKQVNAQIEGTEVLREVAALISDAVEVLRPVAKFVIRLGKIVKWCGSIVTGCAAVWFAFKYIILRIVAGAP